MLHDGGVHEAVTAAPPAFGVLTAPEVEFTVTTPAFEELQVSGTPVMMLPWVSVCSSASIFMRGLSAIPVKS